MNSQFYLPFESIEEILHLQYALNHAYNSDVWVTDPSFDLRFALASDDEMNEFYKEIRVHWDWYSKKKDHYDAEKALFELVDAAHFILARFLRHGSADYVNGIFRDKLEIYYDDMDLLLPVVELQPSLHKVRVEYLNMDRFLRQAESGDSIVAIEVAAYHFIRFIAEALALLGIYNVGDFRRAYVLKNERNHERVRNGVMQGVDVKASEQPLVLEQNFA